MRNAMHVMQSARSLGVVAPRAMKHAYECIGHAQGALLVFAPFEADTQKARNTYGCYADRSPQEGHTRGTEGP